MRSTLLYVLFLLNVQFAFCQWENLNTGLTDDLTGVVFFGNNGLVSGKKGLYYTSNGGEGASSWKRFEITDGSENANIYNNTVFSHCYSDITGSPSKGVVFACGQNALTKQAIIMKIELPSLNYQIIYKGEENSNLNQITYSEYNRSYFAVGENGLIVTFTSEGVQRTKNLGTDNFLSVAFYHSRCKIATAGKILYFEYFDLGYNFVPVLTPGSDIKAITYGYGTFSTGVTFCAGNRFAYYSVNNSLNNDHANFYNGPLNAKCISANSTGEYVGTDHGVYFVASSQALEWQSTSLNYGINCFWKQMANTAFYACGNSGVILKTTNGGGTRIPYVNISRLAGGCAGSNVTLKPLVGGVSSCKWFVNDVQVNSVCGNLTYNFKTPGNYDIRYTVTNSFGVESTDSKTIYVSPIPKINLPVIINDNILCKSEPVTVQIQNSEIDVVYTLRKGSSTFGTSEAGNGQTLSFTSDLISESGDYYFEAKNVNANCTVSFTNTFHIDVEHTKAEFYKDLVNAKPNETTSFYQKAIEAQHYKWNFSPNASTTSSTDAVVETSFSKEGDTKIDLEVWSDNDCYDKIEKEGPFIYNDPENSDNCWALINDGVDSDWNGYEYEGNYGLTKTEDGFLVAGGFNDQIFDSKIGIKPNFKNKKGSFLTKYDRNGVVKWMVSAEHEPVVRDRDKIFCSVVDHDGNIYISGTHQGIFIDNTGNRIKIDPIIGENRNTGYVMKMDKKGKIIWTLSFSTLGYVAEKLYIDKENNLVTIGYFDSQYSGGQLYLNGVKTEVIKLLAGGFMMMKIAPTGAVKWFDEISISYVNAGGLTDVGFDRDNNIYLGGNYEMFVSFYSAGNSAPVQTLEGDGGYGSRGFLAKYNKDGIFQWKVRSNTKDAFFNGVSIKSMVTDENGDSYITGSNGCDEPKAIHFFENSDGTITQKSIGSFYLAKVNSLGKCEWITGTQYTGGGGAKIIKDKDKLHIIGDAADGGNFITADGKYYNLLISNYDFFLATYDLSGNLKKITANGDNKNHVNVPYMEKFDFFKAEDGSFYLSSNFRGNNYSIFGSKLTTNGIDGTVVHFDEDCGILKYENTLSTEDFTKTSNAVIYPNPTSGKISVDLKNYDGNASVQIYDANGKKISEEKAVDLSKLDLTINGSQGLYFVKIKAGNKTQTFKVLKQ
ncbi:Por secretion system C-terminal sorting domain-containing protein [Flavobacterium sp. CF108]|uniref:T9SS type A sorting domain-containing protein n=1 Tax=unclassified Flavobacterium TaxID=196869 RepID=UPI0008C22B76|nr:MULTISPECIES: T9SS type A sorting domain-containing protein [unclassified Flavobacterium]SEP14264.1 Por secretion system C-terminal sorting domain-containing protein [Flavobacterium sp. fv08]SHH49587.1 Por secretion system C-terminal sorting domain-containing protein [Flavobacterium sp. CF108]